MFVAYALMLSAQPVDPVGPLPPVETYDFLANKDDRCIKQRSAECDQMSEPRVFRGIWRAAFETSTLTPPGMSDCLDPRSNTPCIWLEGKSLPWAGKGDCRSYEVEFVGRRSLYMGMYGHMGGSPYQVVVDRLISAKRLPNPECEWCSGG